MRYALASLVDNGDYKSFRDLSTQAQLEQRATRQRIVVSALVAWELVIAREHEKPVRSRVACIGHALELSGDKRSVAWQAGEVQYLLTPVSGFERGGRPCRNYILAVTGAGEKKDSINGAACRAGDGSWQVVS